MTTIILTRHGHVDWIAPERFRGRAELPLSELGKRQAEALASRVAEGWKPDAIYTSPLSRCVHMGEAIGRATGLQPRPLDALADTDYGLWQGRTHEEVRASWPDELRLWLEAPDLAVIPAGETLAAVLVRAINVLQVVLHKHQGQTIVLVGHDSINRILLLHALGMPLSRYWRIKQAPCCLNEIEIQDTVFTVHRVNENHHAAGFS